MVFTVYACADLYGDKVNFELGFNGVPSLHDLHVRVVEVFTVALCECGDDNRFRVSGIVVHNRRTDTWDEVRSPQQLSPQCQLYVFQPGHRDDVSKPLPRPMLPPAAVAPSSTATAMLEHRSGVRSSRLGVSAHGEESMRESGRAGTQNSMVRSIALDDSLETTSTRGSQRRHAAELSTSEENGREDAIAAFAILDTDRDGVVTLNSLLETMETLDLDTSPDAVGDTFAYGDRNVTAADFKNFGAAYPSVVRQLRFRLERAGSSAVAQGSGPGRAPPPAGRPSPQPTGRRSPVIRRVGKGPPELPPNRARPVSPAVGPPPPRHLDSHQMPPRVNSDTLRPSDSQGRHVRLETPLSAMNPAELDATEIELLRLLEEVRRKRAAFDDCGASLML